MQSFFQITIWKDANVPKINAENAAKAIRKIFNSFIEYEIA